MVLFNSLQELLHIQKIVYLYLQLNKLIFILALFVSQLTIAQNHQWAANLLATPNSTYSYAVSTAIAIDSLSNNYVIGRFMDTLKIGSKNFVSPVPSLYSYFFAKFDSDGKLLWLNNIYRPYQTTSSALDIRDVKVLSLNRILISGFFSSSILKLSKKDSIINTSKKYIGFVAIYDSLGSFIDWIKTFEGTSYGMFASESIALDKQGNLYLLLLKGDETTGSLYYKGGSIPLTSNISNDVLVKYAPDFKSILWYKEFPSYQNFRIRRLRQGNDSNLYISATSIGGKFILGKTTYRFPNKHAKGIMVVLSPKGNYIHSSCINGDTLQQDNVLDIMAIDTNHIYVIGFVQDSIKRNGKWYSASNKKSNGIAYPFIGLISTTANDKWINLTGNKDNATTRGTGYYYFHSTIAKLNFDNIGNVFAMFNFSNNILSIGGLTDSNKSNSDVGFAKFDNRGNALLLRSFVHVTDMRFDSYNNLVYTGAYKGKINLPPYNLNSSRLSSFLAKVEDYSITRGNIKSGPYCAGDTIRVSYTKNGRYDTSNYFIAELSDENGNFEGKERELGRLKTNKDSTVKGTLPLFNVATSGKYRIRIRSTNPVVQSFYQYDILRLLIYSRDKANPGPPETICYGNTIKLNTYGGTKWTWSPKYKMNDSTLRQPLVWPEKTTTYKIIIADSSGCGRPDTAYKMIIVRKPLKATLAFKDTAVCDNSALKIPVRFEGGDSNYHWKWFAVSSDNSWTLITSGKFKGSDTLTYSPKVTLNDSLKIALILRDECTESSNTTFLTIRQKNMVFIANKFKDTIVCNGNMVALKAKAKGSVSGKYQWQWFDLTNNKIISNSDSINFIIQKTKRIKLSVNDECQALGDSAEFTITVKPPLKASIFISKENLNDTTVCFGQSLKLYSIGKGGKGTGYNYKWYLDKTLLSTSDTLFFKNQRLFLKL